MNEIDLKLVSSYANNLSYIFLSYGEYDDVLAEKIIDTGITLATDSYKAVKENRVNTIHIDQVTDRFKKDNPKANNGDVYFYFRACSFAGVKIAEGNPEEINNTLNHAHRLPNKKNL